MIRRPLKFEGPAGTYTWPRYSLEYDHNQPLINSTSELVGADYVYDALEDLPAVKGPGTHTIRYLLIGAPADIEDEVDEMRQKLRQGARGTLTLEADDGSQRVAPARIQGMPDIRLGTRDRRRQAVVLTFTQFANFENLAPIDEHDGAVQEIIGDPAHIFVNMPGNAIQFRVRITLKGPFTNPRITNESHAIPGTTVPYRFETSRDGAGAANWLEVDVGANSVRSSADSGSTWIDDSALVELQDGQVGLFALGPGLNDLTIEGASGATIEFDTAGAWE